MQNRRDCDMGRGSFDRKAGAQRMGSEGNPNRAATIRRAAASGLRKGLIGYVWMLKILVPVSLATALLDYSGWIGRLDFLIEPAMGLIGLPPAAALPILIGALAGVYACIAAMSVLPFTHDQMTLITIFVLIAHNLPQEGLIQARSGIGFVKTTLVRLAAAFLSCMAAGWFLGPGEGMELAAPAAGLPAAASLGQFARVWLADTFRLCLKILPIILAVMVLIELMKAFDLVDGCVRLLGPVLKLMGLDRQTGVLWLTGALFGLAYGGAVIVEQARELKLDPREIEKLQLSIGINHSMIEDPLLFMSLGLGAFWMWVPRLAAAVAEVYAVSLWFHLRGRWAAVK